MKARTAASAGWAIMTKKASGLNVRTATRLASAAMKLSAIPEKNAGPATCRNVVRMK